MNTMFDFEKLRVWQQSRALAKLVYLNTKSVPREETYGYLSQIRRAAISVCCNIAEGSGRRTGPDQRQFYVIARGSLMEVMNLIILGEDFGYLTPEQSLEVRKIGLSSSRKLTSLIESRKHS